jgi:predicted HTH transcriptional regulator
MLKKLLKQAENEKLEYKASFGKEAMETLAAFANSKGGTLLVGVNGGVNDLLEYIQSNPGKKTADLKVVFNLPQRTLERWLKQLKGENKIEFRGPPKTGGYFTK